MSDTATTLLTTLIGMIATYLATRSQTLGEVQAKFDIALIKQRIAAHKDLWKALEDKANYEHQSKLGATGLKTLSGKLRHWYFNQGGLSLTDQSRDNYFELQDGIQSAIAEAGKLPTGTEIAPDRFEGLRELGSRLRSSIRSDLRSRRQPGQGVVEETLQRLENH